MIIVQDFQVHDTYKMIQNFNQKFFCLCNSLKVLMMFLPMVILFTALKFLDLDDPEVKQVGH